jgi:hypothetical protein
MQGPSKTIALLALLAACLVAAVYIAMPFYTRSREERNRYRPNSDVLQMLQSTDVTSPTRTGQFPCVAGSLTDSGLQTQLTQCGSLGRDSGPVDRFEVDLRYGNFILRQSDLYLSDVFNVPLTRTYNSGDYLGLNRVHAFGRNTNHPYYIEPMGTRYPYTYQMLVLEDGDFVHFARVSQGTSYSDAVYQHTETSSRFDKAVTAWNGNGWTTWLTDGSLMVFPEAYGAKNTAQGAPVEMQDAVGDKLELLRDGERNLQEIRTPHKHSIKFQYDGQACITRAEDDKGNWAEYRYNIYDALTDVVSSSGRERHYSYDGDLMTQIQDEKGHVLLRNSYGDRRLVHQEFGNGQAYSYIYAPSPNRTYADSVKVTLPDGTTTQIEAASAVPEAVKHPPN